MDALSTTDHALLLAMSEVRGLCKKTELAQVLEEIATSPTAEREKKHEGPVGAVLDQLFEQADRVRIAFWERELERLSHVGIRLATVCDADYPVNLRMVFNRPAYLFYTGELRVQDQCAVAVVGTRKPSSVGLRMATAVAEGLADEGVTVVSGLALGVDIAAHAGALNRRGRTLAVLGSGIEHVAPVKHRPIATQIAALQRGAVVSQFPPDMRPQRWSFPMRNVVTSGLSTATVVVEAGPTSGARLQAESCLEHGKKLLLVEQLVTEQEWAKSMAARPGVAVVSTVTEIVELAVAEAAVPADIL